MAYQSLEEIVNCGIQEGVPFWKVVLLDDIHERTIREEDSLRTMHKMWEAMVLSLIHI